MKKNNPQPAYWAVIPAAGVGKRMQAATPKQYLPLLDKSILFHSIDLFIKHPMISGIIVAISEGDEYWPEVKAHLEKELEQEHLNQESSKPLLVAPGGKERSDSVLSALKSLNTRLNSHDWVLVHDAARPCLLASDIDKLIAELSEHAVGGLLGLPMADTVKLCDKHQQVQNTIDRSQLWRALTPQMFRYSLLLQALSHAQENDLGITDESSALELLGYQPQMIEGHNENIKITLPGDLALAEQFIKNRNNY